MQVVAEAFKVLKVVEKHTDNTFNFQEHLFGGVSFGHMRPIRAPADIIQCSIDAHNNPLTDEALAAAKGADAIILGAVGGPVWQHHH